VPVRARFRPHPRGFGFANPVAADGVTETTFEAPDADGAVRTFDSAFVPPPVAKGLVADDLVEIEVAVDDKGASVASATVVERPRKMLVGTVQHGPGRLVLEPDPALGSGWIDLAPTVEEAVKMAVGRQVVVLAGQTEDGAPIGQALVAGPHVPGSPQAVRANAVVVALGRAAPTLVSGGPAAAGLDPVYATTTHARVVGHLAGGGRGAAPGLDTDGPVPGHDLDQVERRDEPCVTIDDPSARDLDDAIHAAWDGSDDAPVQVAVHIADAGMGVGIGSEADLYARTVASSAYFRVGPNAPMLDPALSESALSLLPGEDRWALSVRFRVHTDGQVTDVSLEPVLIRSQARLSYHAVEDLLAGDRSGVEDEAGGDRAALGVVHAAIEAARRLGAARDARSTFEELFAAVEVEPAVVDGKLTVVDAEPHAAAYRLVERLMVAANEAVASWLVEHDVPALFRAHVGIDPERRERLAAAAAIAEADVPALADPDAEYDVVAAQVLAEVERLEQAGRIEDRDLLVAAATSSTARANYDPDPAHHRGLGAGAYCHFTSPIRRYADLVVHRQIRAALAGEAPPLGVEELQGLAGWLDERSGAVGYAATRERIDLWSRLLDRGYLAGAEEAVVTGVTQNGLRIRLPRLGLSGFLAAEKLLGLPTGERGSLEVDEHGVGTTSGPWRLGTHLPVRFSRLDQTGRPVFLPGDIPGGGDRA
jgi:ribonuclease R